MVNREIILDGEDFNPFSKVCTYCKHETGMRTCKAFPNGIPKAIWNGQNNHKKPYPGDHGIQFEPINKKLKQVK